MFKKGRGSFWTVLSHSVFAISLLTIPTEAWSESIVSCPPQPRRPNEHVSFVQAIVNAGRSLQNIPNAGLDPTFDVRRTYSLNHVKNWCLRNTALPQKMAPILFYAEHLTLETREDLPASNKTILCMIQSGDPVLLSDRITHHLVFVLNINHRNHTISLLDAWPDQSFLKKGHNELNIEAKVHEDKQGLKVVEITWEEFTRATIGFVSFASPELLEYLERIDTKLPQNSYRLSALGLSLSGRFQPSLSSLAVDYLERGLTRARESGNDELVRAARSALHLGHFRSLWPFLRNDWSGQASSSEIV